MISPLSLSTLFPYTTLFRSFAFRSRDINEIKKTLEFFGVDKEDEGNQRKLRELENGQCLIQDLYGRVGIIQVHPVFEEDRKSTRLNSSHVAISYAVFCLKKKIT